MKKLGLSTLLLLLLLSTCKKDIIDEGTTPNPTIIDKWTQDINNVNGSVVGLVVNENEEPIPDVEIKLRNLTTTTDAFGHFILTDVTLNTLGTFVTADKNGFFKGSRRFFPIADRENRIKIKMIEKSFDQTIDSQTGGIINIGTNASVDFKGSGFILANGDPYNGTVHVATKYLDPTSPSTFDQIPGNLQGVNSSYEEVVLRTYGMIGLEMEGDNGEPLNINSTSPAELKVKVPNALLANAPSEIPLWFFDEEIGMWVEEGNAILQNGQYVGEVEHFTFWNCDAPFPLVEMTFQVTDENEIPIENVKVQLSFDGPNSVASVVSGYTDSNGEVSGKVPKGETLTLIVSDQCDNDILTKEVGPFDGTSNSTLVATPANSVELTTISGTLEDCNGDLLDNGALMIKEGNNTSLHFITGGDFSFNIVTCNSGDEIEVIGLNMDSLLQSNPIVAISGTTNTLGNISVCPQAFILISEAGFEDNDPFAVACGNGNQDGRDCWRQPDLGAVIQITVNPPHSGIQGAKLPADNTRIGYQRVQVKTNTEYTLSFFYTMENDNQGNLTVAILDDAILTDITQVPASIIASTVLMDQTDPSTYIMESLVFNSEDLTEVAIFFTNEGVECRLDDFSIVEN